jgi:hypothetical protein
MGLHPTGVITYQPNGLMAVQIMHDPRPAFAKSRVLGTNDEVLNAYSGYYAYWGTFSIDEANSTVDHKIQGSLWPEEVGTTRRRAIKLDAGRLILTTPAYRAGTVFPHDLLEKSYVSIDEQLVNRLTWARME